MVSFKNIGMSGKLLVLVGVFVAGMVVFSAVAFTTLNSVVIGSDLDKTLDIGKDVAADFAPPSASLLPANFLLYRMIVSHNRDDVRDYMTRFEEARKEFENRRQFWLNRLVDGELKDPLKKTFEPADQFFSISQNEILPLIDAGKMDQANQLRHDKLVPLYATYERAVDEFVRLADRQDAKTRANAESTIQWRRNLMIAVLVVYMVIGGAVARSIALGISGPVAAMTSAMHRLAGHDMTATVEAFLGRADEIGLVAGAVQTFRDNIIKADQLSAEQEREREAQMARTRRIDELTKNFEAGVGKVLETASVQSSTQDTVGAISGITETIGKVFELSVSTAAAVEQQEAATKEIARNVQQAAEGTREVTANITGVTSAAEQTGAAATEVLTAANNLNSQAQTLRDLVTKFLADVKAA